MWNFHLKWITLDYFMTYDDNVGSINTKMYML